MIALAIPLILRKVRPNPWYGFRTRKTLSHGKIWYAANRYAGKALLLAGGVIVVAALALHWVFRVAQPQVAPNDPLEFALWLAVLVVPLAACVIASLVHLARL
jgi:uncharacterized membrane protein